MEFVPLPVYDPRVRKWRVIILVNDGQQISARLPVDGWKTEQEARIVGLALLVALDQKGKQTP